MPEPRRLHKGAILVLSLAMAVLGVAMLVVTLSGGGGPLSVGVVFGVLFVAAGAGRFYVTWRHG